MLRGARSIYLLNMKCCKHPVICSQKLGELRADCALNDGIPILVYIIFIYLYFCRNHKLRVAVGIRLSAGRKKEPRLLVHQSIKHVVGTYLLGSYVCWSSIPILKNIMNNSCEIESMYYPIFGPSHKFGKGLGIALSVGGKIKTSRLLAHLISKHLVGTYRLGVEYSYMYCEYPIFGRSHELRKGFGIIGLCEGTVERRHPVYTWFVGTYIGTQYLLGVTYSNIELSVFFQCGIFLAGSRIKF